MSDTSTLFDLLAADTRRRLLLLLCETESVRVPEGLLPRGETRTEPQKSPRELDPPMVASREEPTDTRALEARLVHVHVPKLAQEGVVEWDRETRTVTRGPVFAEIESALSLLSANADKFPDDLL